jgi:hypothetical protein
VRLDVKDAGAGISRADQARIFQAFERVTTSSRVGGLGLGLYIGRQIAVAHGGTLSVDSKPGQGATFTAGAADGDVGHPQQLGRLNPSYFAVASVLSCASADSTQRCSVGRFSSDR